MKTVPYMAAPKTTISTDAGKPDAALPVANSCTLPGAATSGELTGSPIPIEPTIDGMAYLIAEILSPEPWAAAHNREFWNNEGDWRSDATGAF
jgi:hypothetical protein